MSDRALRIRRGWRCGALVERRGRGRVARDVGESGVFGDDPGGEEVRGRWSPGSMMWVVVSPSSAIGAGGAEGASRHFDGADNFVVSPAFEPYV